MPGPRSQASAALNPRTAWLLKLGLSLPSWSGGRKPAHPHALPLKQWYYAWYHGITRLKVQNRAGGGASPAAPTPRAASQVEGPSRLSAAFFPLQSPFDAVLGTGRI